jgi:hypothetical protein
MVAHTGFLVFARPVIRAADEQPIETQGDEPEQKPDSDE